MAGTSPARAAGSSTKTWKTPFQSTSRAAGPKRNARSSSRASKRSPPPAPPRTRTRRAAPRPAGGAASVPAGWGAAPSAWGAGAQPPPVTSARSAARKERRPDLPVTEAAGSRGRARRLPPCAPPGRSCHPGRHRLVGEALRGSPPDRIGDRFGLLHIGGGDLHHPPPVIGDQQVVLSVLLVHHHVQRAVSAAELGHRLPLEVRSRLELRKR